MPRDEQAGRGQHGSTTWEPNHPRVGGGGPCIHLGVAPRIQTGPLVRVELRRVGVVACRADDRIGVDHGRRQAGERADYGGKAEYTADGR